MVGEGLAAGQIPSRLGGNLHRCRFLSKQKGIGAKTFAPRLPILWGLIAKYGRPKRYDGVGGRNLRFIVMKNGNDEVFPPFSRENA